MTRKSILQTLLLFKLNFPKILFSHTFVSEDTFTFDFLFQEIEIKIESLDTFSLILKLVEILNRPQSEPNSSCESISAFSSHKALSIKRNKFYNLASLSMMLVQQMRTHLEGPVLNVARTHHTILRFPQLRDPLILSISKALLSGLGPT